jgi:hypothetical protein
MTSAQIAKAVQRMEAEAMLTHDQKNGYRLSLATNAKRLREGHGHKKARRNA